MTVEPDPHHPIIKDPWTYHITDFHYHLDQDSWEGAYIDMTLVKEAIVRRLRFWRPVDLEIENGFPVPTSGMVILDVRSRQMEGIGIHVADVEASYGKVTFWAYDVEDLDDGKERI